MSWSLALEVWNWLARQVEGLWVLLPLGAILFGLWRLASTYGMERLREGRAAKADQKRAASEFVHVADEFRRYWAQRYYDDQNAEPDPNPTSSVVWRPENFDPLLTPQRHPLYSRLSSPLRNQALAVDQQVKDAKEEIASLARYDENQIDYDGPIIVCEIAIAADALWESGLKEAGLKRPFGYDTVGDFKSDLIKLEDLKKKAHEEQIRVNKELFGETSIESATVSRPNAIKRWLGRVGRLYFG